MSLSDNLGDTLVRIKNAARAGRSSCMTYFSKEKEGTLQVLAKNDIIAGYKLEQEGAKKVLRISFNEKTQLYEFKRISTPGRRMYIRSGDIHAIKGGRGIVLVSTSKGIMSGTEAKSQNIGGELLAEIY